LPVYPALARFITAPSGPLDPHLSIVGRGPC